MESLDVLITVKTYPIPSKRFDELVCTAGVKEDGSFVRLYPINFRDLPFSQQYKKYQWISVNAERYQGRDVRKESYRPDCDSLVIRGEPIPTRNGDWSERGKFVLRQKSESMEHLKDQQERDRTSLGIFQPKKVHDLIIADDDPDWSPKFKAELAQHRLWDDRKVTIEPPRKVPYKLQYLFTCDDSQCKSHRMMIEDWEVGALYWRCVDRGDSPRDAANEVRRKFLGELCGETKDTHFYVGTVLNHPKSWVVIGVFWPTTSKHRDNRTQPALFE